ncbi:casein kinase II subunit beta-2 [Polytolypa hystricis UAMH7299]|uniref:Casein kinase II subunit beta n=1 Tax=Polytolypa hystricis (strain UAMH7299) TaxID=1447883 RepID=A0A2B7Y9R9_POLH7|nr:casein kinase II subunit beta-2 [Polytolypa hystricis UAMH7299]
MEDFNSETDSDYTSYWRDWDDFRRSERERNAYLFEDSVAVGLRLDLMPSRRSGFMDVRLIKALFTVVRWDIVELRTLWDRTGGIAHFRNTSSGGLPLLEQPRSNYFISSRGNEYFCEIDEEYLMDRFNLTGLNTEVQYYQYALDLVTDVFDLDADDDLREQIEKSARHLYGLVHARYVVTTRGLAKMLEKYKKADFGKCPRVLCDQHPLLPMGLSDLPGVKTVKLYCAKCEDIYNPKSSRHASVDGAYFGSSFHNILFQVYPALLPEKSIRRYEPKVFGFRVHAAAALARWQDRQREDMKARLKQVGFDSPFVEDREVEEEEEEEDDYGDSGIGEFNTRRAKDGGNGRMDLGA